MMAKLPKPQEVWSNDFLQCRSWSHAWTHVITYVVSPGRRTAYELHLRCTRCGCERFDLLTRGRLETRTYRYPQGYLVKDAAMLGGRKKFNADNRDALVQRLAIPKPPGGG